MRYKVGLSSSKFGKSSKKKSSRKASVFGLKGKFGKKSKSGKSGFKYRKVKKYSKKKGSHWNKNSKLDKKSKIKKKASKVLGVFLGILTVGILGVTIFVGATLASIKASLPNPDELIERDSAQSTRIYDRYGPDEGTLLYTIYGDQNREFASIDKMPNHTKWALLAAEDYEYYDHKGLDLPGIATAAYRNLVKKETIGASTISQQLVRNTLLYDFLGEEAYERSLTRKAKEALLTMQLEQSFSKDEILQMYMNEIPLGGTNYGFQAASKSYFGKDVSELTLAESAMLAGLIQAPGTYSPLFGSQPELAIERQHYVLDQLYEKRDYIEKTSKREGEELVITKEIIEDAKNEEITYAPIKIDINAPHFVFFVKERLIEEYGIDRVERGGLKVTTSLDYEVQQIAEEEVRAGVDKYRAAHNVNNGAMIVIDPRTGEIISMVGSYDYWTDPDPTKIDKIDGNVNITTSPRQPGSSVKPITYLTSFHKGYNPGSIAPDIKFKFGWDLKNWDNRFKGLMTSRQALVESRNFPAVLTLEKVGGVDEFIKTSETLGYTTFTERDRYGLSITLGAAETKLIEHANAYATYATGGIHHDVRPVIKVENSKGEDLTPEEWKDTEGVRVWDEKEIYLLNWVLCDMSNQGRLQGQYYSVGNQKLCGKTGTTDGPRDLSTILYYPNLVTAVWTGNNNNDLTIGSAGIGWSTTVPLPIAHSFMSRVINKYGSAWYSRPGGVVSGVVCKETGNRPGKNTSCSKEPSVFIEGQLPPADGSFVEKPICKENGKVATNESEANALGLIEYKTYLKIKLPSTISRHQSTLDAWLSKNSKYGSMTAIPSEAECPLHLGPGNAPTVSIATPTESAAFAPGSTMNMTVSVNSLHGVSKVEYSLDGGLIATATNSPYSASYTIPGSLSTGNHTLSAKVYDVDGKTGTDSVTIVVSDVSVSMTSPTNGSSVTLPTPLRASTTGSVSSVVFIILDDSGSTEVARYTGVSIGGGVWSSTWTGTPAGNYQVLARASSGGSTFDSSRISVKVL